MKSYTAIDRYLGEHMDASIAELTRLCAQPSVSAQNLGLAECAELTASLFRQRGFQTQVIPTGGAPVVYAERKGKSAKSLLFYNHYDVQPPEPLELWVSPPFQPQVRDGKLYARGVNDDKGEIACRLLAIDAILAQDGDLPCTFKFIIEGEEETSSLHLEDFVKSHTELLNADACVWEGGGVNFLEHPTQALGMRGICYVELSVETANQDVHSGMGGSMMHNAAWRLVWALGTLKGPDERIRIPGYYDAVVPPSPRDRELMAALPDNSEDIQKRYGVQGFLKGMQGGVDLRVAGVFEPTCTICGLTSGYQGPGSKTVQPARASAKVDFRLVPNQTPALTLQLLRAHLDREGFSDVQVKFLGGEAPGRTNPDHPFVRLAVETAEDVYHAPVEIIPMIGGSGPNHVFIEALQVPIVGSGIGYPGGQAHAPNENIRLDLYLKGAQHAVRLMKEFGEN